jgi:drug/metabolite transporter (DMT)-like permease
MLMWLCVAARIISNPLSNAFQKVLVHRGADPLFVIFATYALLSAVCGPLLLVAGVPSSWAFWGNISFCAVLAVASNVLLVHALRSSDLSIVGPINAYKPVVSLIPAIVFLHEMPGLLALIGISLIVAGNYLCVDSAASTPRTRAWRKFLSDPGVRYRFAALILSAVEAVFLKKAILVSSATTAFLIWSVLGMVVSLACLFLPFLGIKIGHEFTVMRSCAPTFGMLFVTTGVMQLCTLVVLERFQVGAALALFQTSVLVSVVLGRGMFREPHFERRLGGSAVMVIGAVLIILGR